MCGVAGYLDNLRQSSATELTAIATQMVNSLRHRGPDDHGVWVDESQGMALAHRRLSVLDISSCGHQPMCSSSRRYHIIYNGEIYNYLKIKQQLEQQQLSPIWQGHSDTEVLLAAFDAWGVEKTLKLCVGMFAIVLWDAQEQLLYLARDRVGEKPLYYGWIGNFFVFGSELKALKQHPAWQPTIQVNSLALQMRYNCIPAPHTIYKNIYKVMPGHILVINKDKQLQSEPYWQLNQSQNNFPRGNGTEITQAIDGLEQKLSQAVQQQMVADVPVGAFLSGGIDSSLIVALMQKFSAQPVKTFTIGFADHAYNEAEHAKAVATHLQTEHTELYLSAEEIQGVIAELPQLYDEPFSDSSQLPTYIVAKLARSKVTVSLSGDGGDELFAGYNRYSWVPEIWKKISFMPFAARRLLAMLLQSVSPRIWDRCFYSLLPILPKCARQTNPGDKLHKLAGILQATSPQDMYHKLISHWQHPDSVVLDTIVEQQVLDYLMQRFAAGSIIEKMMYADMHQYLPDDLLVKVDRAAMAVSLETRMPFLDHRVIEYAWSLPIDLKLRAKQSKWLLRQLLYRYVPKNLIERPKMGFGIPIDQWLRGPLKDWAGDLLSSSMLARHGLLDEKLIQNKWREHLSGVRNWQYHLWDILMFQAWYSGFHEKEFVDG